MVKQADNFTLEGIGGQKKIPDAFRNRDSFYFSSFWNSAFVDSFD
jgi:hypothetical protein